MEEQDHADEILSRLTAKQRQVLDLLIEHKTSKEIARELGISPHTVDQRIQFARQKLGARTRSEAAVAYRRLLEICGKMTYEESGIAAAAFKADDSHGAQASIEEPSQRTRTESGPPRKAGTDDGVVRELFDGRYGTLIRLGAIVAIAVLLLLFVLVALDTFSQLSQLMGK